MSSLAERLQRKQEEESQLLEKLANENLKRLETVLNERLRSVLYTTAGDIEREIEKVRENFKSAVEPLSKELNQVYKESEAARQSMESLEEQSRNALHWSWVRPTIIALAILLTICGSLWGLTAYLSEKLVDTHRQLQDAQRQLALIENHTWGTVMMSNGNERYIQLPGDGELVVLNNGKKAVRLE